MESMTLLEALGTVALALLSGAGGAALLDLYYKPRRDCKKAATLLLAEILINTELLLLQAHARAKNPRGIPGDFKMSTLAWDTAAPVLAELPAPVLKSALVLYNRYHYLNNCVALYKDALADIERHPPGPHGGTGVDARAKAERQADLVLDVFNTGIDAAIDHAKELTPLVFALAKIDPTAPPPEQADFQGKVDKLFAERHERLRRLRGEA
jgi:hypothetical protein